MTRAKSYTDRNGQVWDLTTLDAEESRLIADLQRCAAAGPAWHDFDNHRRQAVTRLYDGRGMPRKKSMQTAVYRIAQDMSLRMMVDQGLARPSDYRDELEAIIATRFKTRRAFCEATGLTEDMLSHVLARRKDLSIERLTDALSRIGYTMRIVPSATAQPTAKETKVG